MLAPLYYARLEVDLLSRHLLYIDVLIDDFLFYNLAAFVVSLVEIYGSDKSL